MLLHLSSLLYPATFAPEFRLEKSSCLAIPRSLSSPFYFNDIRRARQLKLSLPAGGQMSRKQTVVGNRARRHMFGMFKKELIEEQPCNDSLVRKKGVMEVKLAGISCRR